MINLDNCKFNKTIAELADVVEAGGTIYAHTGELGETKIGRFSPGKYIYEFDFAKMYRSWSSEEGDNHTLFTFLESIDFTEYYEDEMKEMLTQPIWSTIDEETYYLEMGDQERDNFHGLLGDLEINL